MKRVSIAALAVVLLLAGIVAGRTFALRSRQIAVGPAEPIGVDARAAAERLAGAIRFKTISHQIPWEFKGSNFTDLHAYLASSYPRVHAALTREVVAQYSLLYTWAGSDPALAPVVMLAHMDVVPVDAASAQNWQHPPFDGVVTETEVWGRGALDDKSGVIGILEAAEALLAAGWSPKRTLLFAFGHDEELGGPQGAGGMAKRLAERGIKAWMTVDEGSGITDGILPGIAGPVALISVGEKGYVTIELKAAGKGGHSSTPPLRTSLGRVARAVARLEETQMPARLAGPMYDMLATLGPEMDFPLRAVMANLWLFRPLVERQLLANPTTAAALRTTTAPTIFNAGTKENVLPIEARALVNFRILPGDTVADVLAHAQRTVDDPELSVAVLEDHDPAEPSPVSSHENAAFAALARSVREVYPGAPVGPGMTLGGTDSKHYYGVAEHLYRLQPLVFTNADLATIHGTDERVRIDNFGRMIQVYAQIFRNACG